MICQVRGADAIQVSGGQVPTTFLSQVERPFLNRGSRGPAGDQWTVFEMVIGLRGSGLGANKVKPIRGCCAKCG